VTTWSRRRPLAGWPQAESCFAYGDDRFHPVPSISFLYRIRVDETINLSYECLMSPEVCQTLVGLHSADPTLFNQLSVPTPLAPVAPPPKHGSGSYPED
jgi:hypothetical protein